jgi:sugar phosphate isomerase/epimerase
MPDFTRRELLLASAAALLAPAVARAVSPSAGAQKAPRPFRISLAQWSLHRTIRSGKLDHLDFARVTRQEYGLEAIEYVNSFFKDRAKDATYLAEMNMRAKDHGVYQHLIMCDGEGRLGDPDAARRREAVENHRKWLEAARTLGCVSIRVNAASDGTFDEQQKLAADGLRQLCELAAPLGINVIVENHGGLSSNGQWLAGVMKMVDHPRCGTLPDFGNFYDYDRYQGVADLMPFAKAVSAKSHEFDSEGNESAKDYRRLMKIVTDAGYHSWVGIEYEGKSLSEHEGILATSRLLERVSREMSAGRPAPAREV